MSKKASKNKQVSERSALPTGVSSKGNKASVRKETADKEKLTKKQIIIIVCVLLCAVLVSGTIIGAMLVSKKRENPDFMTSDLSRYISIAKEDYSGYEIKIPLDEPSDMGLNRKINTLLTEHKTLNEVYEGGYSPSAALSLGDEVKIYYRGYTVDENGRETDFEGSSNFFDEDVTILEVGTGNVIDSDNGNVVGSFILGFGEGLVGIIPGEYPELQTIHSGNVREGDVIYLSYTVMGEGGNKSVENERIDLSLPYIDDIYGKGFTEFFAGKDAKGIDIDIKEFITRIGDDKTDTVYTDMKISCVTRGCETNPLTISVRFPANYSELSLRGKEAKFDVYIDNAVIYDAPEFNDKFITETLKTDAESLSGYSGESLVDKYRAKLSEELKSEIEDSNHTLLVEAMWSHIVSKTKINRIPKKTLEVYYQSYYNTISDYYYRGNYSSSYGSIDNFAIAYLNTTYGAGLDEGGDWKGFITSLAEGDVVQKLIFYYIIRNEEFIPTGDEYKKIYDEIYGGIYDEYLELHSSELSALKGTEYDEKLQSLKKEFDDYYGDSYFKEQTYYHYGTRKMLELANIIK